MACIYKTDNKLRSMSSFAMLKLKYEFVNTEFQQIDFANITFHENESTNFIVLKIRNTKPRKIYHNRTVVNRCCKKSNHENTSFQYYSSLIKDSIPRISCDTDKQFFFDNYIKKRVPVMMIGCQESWPAKQWTFNGMFYFKFELFLIFKVFFEINDSIQ